MADDDLSQDQSDSSSGAGEESPDQLSVNTLAPDYMPLFVAPQPAERAESDGVSDDEDDGEDDGEDDADSSDGE
ncbi:MAG: hypothetical protein WAM92_04850, partial [Mycobacterium sp.]